MGFFGRLAVAYASCSDRMGPAPGLGETGTLTRTLNGRHLRTQNLILILHPTISNNCQTEASLTILSH